MDDGDWLQWLVIIVATIIIVIVLLTFLGTNVTDTL